MIQMFARCKWVMLDPQVAICPALWSGGQPMHPQQLSPPNAVIPFLVTCLQSSQEN